jgi:hypothetical protein
MFDFDGGMRTARNLKDSFTNIRQSIEFDTYKDRDLKNPVMYVRAYNKLREFSVTAPRAVTVDSLTGLVEVIKRQILKQEGKIDEGPKLPQLGSMINELEKFLFYLRTLKCPVIVNAHDAFVQDKDQTVHHVILSATKPHGRNKLSWLFDEVLYMKEVSLGAGKIDYRVSCRGEGIPARTRSGLFEPYSIMEKGVQGLLKRLGYEYEPRVYKKCRL